MPVKRPPPATGSVSVGEVLTLSELKSRFSISRKTWDTMKKAGLKSTQLGKQRYILGSHVVQLFERLAESGGQADE